MSIYCKTEAKEMCISTVLQMKVLFSFKIWVNTPETTIHIYGIRKELNGRGWVQEFSLLKQEVTYKQGQKAKMIHR